jgi:hypothetical protein
MSAFAGLGTKIRNAWRHYRWPWHKPGAAEWDPFTGREEKEYPRPEPWHHHHEHGQDDTDRQEDRSDPASAMDPEGPGSDSSGASNTDS